MIMEALGDDECFRSVLLGTMVTTPELRWWPDQRRFYKECDRRRFRVGGSSMLDTDDDWIYFADPDKLDTISIDVSSKRVGSSACINEFKTYGITKETDYRLRDSP
jgi:hypothetical protein